MAHLQAIRLAQNHRYIQVDKLNEDGIPNGRDFINYVSMRDFEGEKNFFTKDIAYKYQKEFRIHLGRNSTEPYRFAIGSIADIASIEEVDNIKEISMFAANTMNLHLNRPSKYDIQPTT